MQNFEDIKLLGRELKNKTEYMKHQFNILWVDKLIDFYKENQGKNLIHLSDINDNLFIKLNTQGKNLLRHLAKPSPKNDKNSIKAVKNFLRHEDRFISLRNIRNFIGDDIDLFESFIEEVKTTKSGFGRSIKNPIFPINLNTDFGAILLGNYPDTSIKTGDFRCKDKELLDELNKYFNIYIGKIKPTIRQDSICYNMQLSSIIKIIYRLSGLKTKNRQIISNNGLPYWIFSSSEDFQKLLLRRLWDTEGSAPVNKKMCFGQSIALNGISENIPFYPKRKSFVKCKNKTKILNAPPNLLVSIQLLLYKFEISSYIKPHRLYKKKSGLVVCDWHLLISYYPNIKNFYDKIGFGLERKQEKLKECLDSYTRRYPKDKLIRENEILNIIKDLNKFTILDIENQIDLSRGTIRNYLITLRKKKKIEKTKTISQKNRCSFLNEYKIREDFNDNRIRSG